MNTFNLPYTQNTETLLTQLNGLEGCVWLDSGKPNSAMGRYDILSALPSRVIEGFAHDWVNEINSQLNQHSIESDLPFCGGWIGYIAYNQHIRLGWYEWAIVVDHHHQQSSLVFLDSCPQDIKKRIDLCLKADPQKPLDHKCSAFKPDQTATSYLASIKTIQDYLRAGDCYQVNYTQRFHASFEGSTQSAYLKLRNAVPSPFSAYLHTPNGAILSISPERFIHIEANKALTQPIKGTIQRGINQEQDLRQKNLLHNSKKDLAENVMIVDLLRNDFNRHCEPFSVKVPKLFEVQSFANVHHLVSTITGSLEKDVSHLDFLLSCFPGGSITGAPKKRAMEIIDELEMCSRGVYCGSIGYLSVNNKTDFNIAIRTLQVEAENIYGWAGGGIVLDSDPEKEYQESFDKILRLLKAVETT